jgi:adenylosuccinate synthase
MADLLSEGAILLPSNGGDNAGHTVVNQYGTFKLEADPNGIANLTPNVIGPGVVVNMNTLAKK